jgi:hypothetical protein
MAQLDRLQVTVQYGAEKITETRMQTHTHIIFNTYHC